MKFYLLIAQIGFPTLTLIFYFFLYKKLKSGLDRSVLDASQKSNLNNWLIGGFTVWFVFVSVWSLSGTMADFSIVPFNLMPVIIIPLLTSIYVIFSGKLDAILRNVSQASIIRIQTFRVFVELLLWALFLKNLLPVQMTFEGRNHDIFAGITAPIVALLFARGTLNKTVLTIWNILCLVLLLNIVTIAILSMPSPFRVFMNEPSNTIVATFPISLLPGFLVPLAYTLHFLSLRKIYIERQRKS